MKITSNIKAGPIVFPVIDNCSYNELADEGKTQTPSHGSEWDDGNTDTINYYYYLA